MLCNATVCLRRCAWVLACCGCWVLPYGRWLRQANPVSLNGLGYLYYHGLGVKQDIIQAYDYFEKARKENKENISPDVLFNLGMVRWGGGKS